MDIQNCCAFTGHRPAHFGFKHDETHVDCIALKTAMREAIQSLVHRGVVTYFSGMALGVDMWGAEIVLELKEQYPELRLIAVLPCETQAKPWLAAQQKRHLELLSRCDRVIYISRQYTPNCMLQRNRYMVDRKSVV